MKKSILTLLMIVAATFAGSARELYNLNDQWRFFFSYEDSGDLSRYVTLPHTWNDDALAGIYPYMRSSANYTRSLYIPEEWAQKRLFLRFGGAQTTADLFVNGMHAGSHSGAGVAFTFEISEWVKYGAENQIQVVVNNAPSSRTMPLASEGNIYGGIAGDITLIVTDKVAISPLHYGSDGVVVRTTKIADNQAEGEALVFLSVNSPHQVELTLRGYDSDNRQLLLQRRTIKSSFDFSKPVKIPFIIENPRLWSPQNPQLCRFEVELSSDSSTDCVEVVSGLRCVKLTPEGLFINDQKVSVNGVSLSYDHPSKGGVYGKEAINEDLGLLLDLGATALRSPMAPHPQYLYDRCDCEGLLAWIDLPFARTRHLSDICYYATEDFEKQGEQLLKEIIWQNANHPSVVMWGLFTNLKAIDGRLCDYIRRLNTTAHSCDPTRPTIATSNSDGEINFITDAIVWQQSVGWAKGRVSDMALWLEQLDRNWSHLSSAICYGAEGNTAQQPDSYNRPKASTIDYPERRQSRFLEEYSAYSDSDSIFWGRWINSLSDFGAARRGMAFNYSGLVDYERCEKKDAYYLYRALWNTKNRTLHIADRRWHTRPTEPQSFRIYASESLEPTLLVNGDTVALTRLSRCVWLSDEVAPLSCLSLKVTAEELSAEAEFRCGSAIKRPQRQVPLQTVGQLLIN